MAFKGDTVFQDKTLIIYIPVTTTGGYEQLMANIAKNMSGLYKCKIIVIDSLSSIKNNYFSKFIENITFINADTIPKKADLEGLIKFYNPNTCLNNTSVLMPITLSIQFEENFVISSNIKCIYYIGQPSTYEFMKYIVSTSPFRDVDNFLTNLIQKNNTVLLSMDEICRYEIANKFKIEIPILPVFIDEEGPNAQLKSQVLKTTQINIGFLGRLDSDKIYALINLMDCLINYETDKEKQIHIIGDGDSVNKIDIDFYERHKIITAGKLSGNEKHIQNNIDIMFTAGLACIEQAYNGIPSVMIPFSHNKFYNTDSFTYLFNMNNFNGGYYVESIPAISMPYFQTFDSIMDDIYKNNRIWELACKCLEYVNVNHTFETFYNIFNKYT